MSDDDSHVVSPGAFPNGLYTFAIDDFSTDTEIAKLQRENDMIKVMVRYLDSSGQKTYIINKKTTTTQPQRDDSYVHFRL